MAGKGITAIAITAAAALAAAGLAVSASHGGSAGVVRIVNDGDTLALTDGRKIRLVQIDTPELGSSECYSRAAHRVLLRLAPVGTGVTLEADPTLDQVDRYGRLLRYVRRDGANLNLTLVRLGAAAPYFYRGDRGRYAAQLMNAAREAKAAKRGLWGACPRTTLDPDRAVDTGPGSPPATTPASSLGGTPPKATGHCAASYPTVCIPPPPPDLDCKDIPYRRFTVRWNVADPDPHHFDGNRDGVGCET